MNWWEYSIGGGTVGELVFGLSLLLLIVLGASFVLSKYGHKESQQYPTMAEITAADPNTIRNWVMGLQPASTPSQLKKMRLISYMYLENEGLAVPDDKRINAKSMTCECGKRHPLVRVFGLCGKCFDKKIGL